MEERLKLQRIEICNCSLMIGVAPGAEGVGSVWMDYKEKATKQLNEALKSATATLFCKSCGELMTLREKEDDIMNE